MLKKSFIIELVLLLVISALGMMLTNNNTQIVRRIHTGLGLLAGLNAVAAVYLAYKEQAANAVQVTALALVIFTLLAGIGGKIGETDYANGLMLMRGSALVALVATGVGLLKLKSRSK